MNDGNSGDFAWAESRDNSLSIQDCFVLIGWLSDRVAYLEGTLNIRSGDDPILPSRMDGFGCIPKREEAVMDAFKRMGL